MIIIDDKKFDDTITKLEHLETNIRQNFHPYVADKVKEIRLQLKESAGINDEKKPIAKPVDYEWMWNELKKWLHEQEQFGNNFEQTLGFAYLGVMQKIEIIAIGQDDGNHR
jgi:hypothetical protein